MTTSTATRLVNKIRGGGLGVDAAMTSAVGLGIFALSALTGPILARTLGDTDRGHLAAVVVPTQILGYILQFGIPHASAFLSDRFPRRTLATSAWLVSLVVNLPIVLLATPFVPDYLSEHAFGTTNGFFIASLFQILLFLPMASTLDSMRGEGKALEYNVLRALPFTLNAASVILLAIIGRLDLTTALASAFGANAIGWWATILYGRTLPSIQAFQRSAFSLQIDYGKRAAVGTLAQMVVARFDQILLVPFVAPEQLALYVVAATGASLSSPLGQGVALALFPHVRGADRGDADRRTYRAMAITGGISTLAAIALALIAPWGIPFLFGDDFEGSVTPLLLMLPGQVLVDLGNIGASRLEADDRPGAASLALIAGAVTTVIGLAIAVEPFGIEGAAVVTSLSQLVYLGFILASLRRGR